MGCNSEEIQELFLKLIPLSPAEKAALLDHRCGENQQLRERVEALLRAHDQADSYLDEPNAFLQSKIGLVPPVDVAVSKECSAREMATVDSPNDAVAGVCIAGRYTLQSRIGEGGMGEVWIAKQSQPVQRLVAIKLIKAGMDSKAVIARFEQERQALAMMDHPNIARVLDGGLTPTGQPFFVMELVKGFPITEYCDRMKLSPEKRLELFIPVCHAIQHAHQKGIIHRDIKPANVLIALYDDQPVPKVIDFGIAKATGGALTEHTISTGFGGVLGTPQYMSPEQATLNNLDVDTRSDVYSLGVLLYELLTGSPPFSLQELESRGVLEMLRVVREDEPPRPSVRLSSSNLLPRLSANRSMEPGKLAQLLRSELDWIVLKALEKQRTRRYETASGFAADVLRYLSGDRVLAHPPGFSYQLRKVIQRNRGLVVALSLIAGAMLAGLGTTTWQMLRADAEAIRANQEADRANQEAIGAERARDRAESTLLASYFRPIGYNEDSVDPAELVVFKEIAAHKSDRLKLLVIRSALSDGPLATRAARRANHIVQSVVGLSLTRREQALMICREKLSDAKPDPEIFAAALAFAQALGDESLQPSTTLPGKESWIDALTSALKNGQNAGSPDAWDAAIRRLVTLESLDPGLAEATFKQLMTPLTQTTAGTELQSIDYGKTLWERLPANAASQRSAILVEISRLVAESDDQVFSEALAQLLSLYRLMTEEQRTAFLFDASESLYLLPPRMSSHEANLVYQLLMENLGDVYTLWGDWHVVAFGLDELAPRLDREAARGHLDALATVLTASENQNIATDALLGLAGLLKVLGPEDSLRVYDLLISYSGTTNDSAALHAVWNAMKELAPNLAPSDAQRGFDSIASDLNIFFRLQNQKTAVTRRRAIAWIVPEEADLNFLGDSDVDCRIAADALAALAFAINPGELTNRCGDLEREWSTFNTLQQFKVVAIMASIAPFLNDAALSDQLDQLISLYLQAPNKSELMHVFGVYLDRTFTRLTPKQAERLFDTFTPGLDALDSKSGVLPTASIGSSLAKLATRLEKSVACRKFEYLIDLTGRSTDENELRDAGEVLVGLALMLDEHHIRTANDYLIQNVLLNHSDPNHIQLLSRVNSADLLLCYKTTLDKKKFDTSSVLQAELVRRNEITYLEQISEKLFEIFNEAEDWSAAKDAFAALELIPRQAKRPSMQEVVRQRAVAFVRAGTYGRGYLPDLLAYVDSVPLLSNLLLDPTRIDDQPVFLARLEAIAFPESLNNEVSSAGAPVELLVSPGTEASTESLRRFRVLIDAAEWISKHHPEIDLEQPFREVVDVGSDLR